MGDLGENHGGVAVVVPSSGWASMLELHTKSDPAQKSARSSTAQTSPIKSQSIPNASDLSSSLPTTENTINKENKDEKETESTQIDNTLSTAPKFDLQDAITKLADSEFTNSDIYNDSNQALDKLIGLKKSIATAAARSKGGRAPIPEQWKDIRLFLYIVTSLITLNPSAVTPEFSKKVTLKLILELFTNPQIKFPHNYVVIAEEIINQIETHNGFETPLSPPSLGIETQAINAGSRKRSSPDGGAPVSAKRSREYSTTNLSEVPPPPPSNHPIFGENGIMRGFLWDGRGYRLNPETRDTFKMECCHYGHNGLTVGDCWPIQLAALRDGAHGASQGGISGDKDLGAYSIMISSHYEGFDQDMGDTVYYSAPGARDCISKEPDSLNPRIQSMRRSISTRKPVRVLRNASCSWQKGPSMGIRYDGLYRVTECEVRTNGKGGKFWCFTLRRLVGQDPIRVSMPGRALMGRFEKVKDGY
ncbi:hypothetical protein EYC80_005809 [Monilinia laxa]|uniref:YDG domain-containing protein n=1 Tax=Monilinia laxa TaxID=61186 RepID=A0A5N6KFC9_MONLA|nr:hypothetical protein EYC80_005809 [Monilinia laxa]